MKTHIDPEEYAYTPRGSMRRKFVAYLDKTDLLVSGKAGIPDTFFSIPGYCRIHGKYVRGYVTMSSGTNYATDPISFYPNREGELEFIPYKRQGGRP